MSNRPDQEPKSNTHFSALEIFRQLSYETKLIYLEHLKQIADKQAHVPAVQEIAD